LEDTLSSGQLPIFYINLASRADRRAFMEGQFAAMGVSAERIEAKTPADVPPDVAEAALKLDVELRITPAEIACTLSHLAAWQQAIDRGAAACLVLEDDGVLSRRLPHFLAELGPALPKGIDLLKVETSEHPVRLGRKTIPVADFTVRRLTSTHYGNCGYVISTALAAKLIADMPLIPLPLDDYLFARRGEQLYTRGVYQLLPALARQLVYQPKGATAETARSDLDATRAQRPIGSRRNMPPLLRARTHLAASWRELSAFGRDAFNDRSPVPFADDA
jgi:glycosyl transferase family 25